MVTRVLIVEDDRDIADLVARYLSQAGFATEVIASGREALAAIAARPPDLLVLDLMLPQVDGLEICRAVRTNAKTNAIPIIMLTARAEESDRIVGLELGADDYIAKPFSPRELLARVRTILRRSGRPAGAEPAATPFALDEERQRVRYYGQPLQLSRYEYGILRVLLQKPGRVFTREELLARIWDDGSESFDRTVDAHIKTLRAKLRAVAPQLDAIRTLRGTGYALQEDLPPRPGARPGPR
jgi:two-component system catabolic regulation response regulator CreB